MTTPTRPGAVVLLSGGLDSATALALAAADGFLCHALSFRYGQRHAVELEAAARVAAVAGRGGPPVLDLPLGQLGGSALTDPAIEVPHDRRASTGASPSPTSPRATPSSWPSRWRCAEVTGSDAIYIGVNAVDYSGYPDCRPEYVEAFQRVAALATRRAVEGRAPRIAAPLIDMTKADIIRAGARLGVDYALTISCYSPDERGPRLRRAAIAAACAARASRKPACPTRRGTDRRGTRWCLSAGGGRGVAWGSRRQARKPQAVACRCSAAKGTRQGRR